MRRRPVLKLRCLTVPRLRAVHLLCLSGAGPIRAQRGSVRRILVVRIVVARHPLVECLLLYSQRFQLGLLRGVLTLGGSPAGARERQVLVSHAVRRGRYRIRPPRGRHVRVAYPL